MTVKELIEALQECPQDYEVMVSAESKFLFLSTIGIDLNEKTVDLFTE